MNIYVGNLDFNLQEEDLKGIFSEFGEVSSVQIIKDKYTGRGKGFGFVEMANDSDGANAIKELDGKEVRSRKVVVNEARPQRKREDYR